LDSVVEKLDLNNYINNLKELFSRDKSLFIDGDVMQHYQFIKEIDKLEFNSPPKLDNFDTYLMHLQKFGTLKIYEIAQFVKMLKYIKYIKKVKFEGQVRPWLDNIVIPPVIDSIIEYFDKEYNIKEGISQKLDSINISISNTKDGIKKELLKLVNSSKIRPYLVDSQVHFVNQEECLLVRGGFNHVINGSIIGRTNAGFFYLLPTSISNLKDKESDLFSQKEEILYEMCKEISATFNKQLKFLRFVDKAYDRFDHYQARVFFAKSKNSEFVIPKKSKDIVLKDFCHPALTNAKPVSIDFSKKVLMITGVNAGGKTMLLKSILSAVYMSKHLIPFNIDKANSKIGSFKDIFAILDDPQSVKNDISTFAGRMREFSKLFGKRDIVVGVDEIELGTDSDEAASLFKVILEDLKRKDIKIVVTTHHKRLAALMANDLDVELLAALYDEKRQSPTYEFLKGTIGKSYAFETAQRYGIPINIVKNAKSEYGEDKEKLNELIERSSELEREQKLKIMKLDKELEDVTRLKESLKAQKESVNKELQQQKSILEKEYKGVIEDVKRAIKSSTKDAHRMMNKAHEKISKVEIKEQKIEPEDFKVGDRVKYNSNKGVIVSMKSKEAFIECDGGFKLRVKLTDLKRSGNPPKPKRATINVNKPQNASMTIDLHGLRGEEAVEKLDKFISDALMSGFDELLVYHGIGTGKLAYAVKEFLKSHPSIKGFNDAPANMGGFGAKIVKL
jgi:DNA mismatch repair protein MutS2